MCHHLLAHRFYCLPSHQPMSLLQHRYTTQSFLSGHKFICCLLSFNDSLLAGICASAMQCNAALWWTVFSAISKHNVQLLFWGQRLHVHHRMKDGLPQIANGAMVSFGPLMVLYNVCSAHICNIEQSKMWWNACRHWLLTSQQLTTQLSRPWWPHSTSLIQVLVCRYLTYTLSSSIC